MEIAFTILSMLLILFFVNGFIWVALREFKTFRESWYYYVIATVVTLAFFALLSIGLALFIDNLKEFLKDIQ